MGRICNNPSIIHAGKLDFQWKQGNIKTGFKPNSHFACSELTNILIGKALMKKILAAFLGIALAAACQLSYAAAAVVTAVTGTVQATGTGATRTLRVGDTLDEGDTVVTLAGSSAVFRFEDGHIAAPHANTRFVVTAYKYTRAQPAQNNVFLTLLVGTMRTITGLVGRQQPDNVSYRAGTATIGIRGTDIILSVDAAGIKTILTVTNGAISITRGGVVIATLTTGNAAIVTGTTITQGTTNDILAAMTPTERAAVNAIINNNALNDAINQALAFGAAGNTQQGSTTNSTSPN